jgi:hypothetical protein
MAGADVEPVVEQALSAVAMSSVSTSLLVFILISVGF